MALQIHPTSEAVELQRGDGYGGAPYLPWLNAAGILVSNLCDLCCFLLEIVCVISPGFER
jgi:hypothetical protein